MKALVAGGECLRVRLVVSENRKPFVVAAVGPHDTNIVSIENPVWVEFARSMMPMMMPAAHAIAERLASSESIKVLDIAAGHGGVRHRHGAPESEGADRRARLEAGGRSR